MAGSTRRTRAGETRSHGWRPAKSSPTHGGDGSSLGVPLIGVSREEVVSLQPHTWESERSGSHLWIRSSASELVRVWMRLSEEEQTEKGAVGAQKK